MLKFMEKMEEKYGIELLDDNHYEIKQPQIEENFLTDLENSIIERYTY